jgi:hypothetical protein
MRKSMFEKRNGKPSLKAAAAVTQQMLPPVHDMIIENVHEMASETLVSTNVDDDVSGVYDPEYNEQIRNRVNLPPLPLEFEVVTEEVEREPIYQTKLSLNLSLS